MASTMVRRVGPGMKVEIKDRAIWICLPFRALKTAVQCSPSLGNWDEKLTDYLEPIVTHTAALAKDVLDALCDEKEDGSTLVHEMFDKAFDHAIDQGADGILMPSDDRYRAARSRLAAERKAAKERKAK